MLVGKVLCDFLRMLHNWLPTYWGVSTDWFLSVGW